MNGARSLKRIIGKYGKQDGNPTMIWTGGIHGNEPAGITAIENVLRYLSANNISINGEIIGIAGNLSALAQNKRFIHKDLNRVWTQSGYDEECPDSHTCIEFKEQQNILAEIDKVIKEAKGKVYFMDLHTTGANSMPFACIGDNLRNRDFALNFPVPIILGLEEQLDGALLEYVNNTGAITVGIEGGQHEDPNSEKFITTILYIALVNSGMLSKKIVENYDNLYYEITQCSKNIPNVLEVRHRHGVVDRDKFAMHEGYKNLQKIVKGQFLSVDHNKNIYAIEKGRILLPLYQALGDDGFFITREVNNFWLKLSKLLRKISAHKLFILLPGVSNYPNDKNKLFVNTKIAKWFATEVFHLLGYRKIRTEGGKRTISRRK